MRRKIKKSVALSVWFFSYFVVFIVSKIFLSIQTYYEDENFKDVKKPMVVVSNHKTPFDPWIIFVSLPFTVLLRLFPIRPFAKKEFKGNSFLAVLSKLKITKFIYYIYDVITIPDTDSFDGKIDPLVEALKNKNTILMFPEGGIFFKEGVSEFKKGAVAIQERSGAPILPCSVRLGSKRLFRRKVFVSFGEVLYIPKDLFNEDESYTEAREYLREKVSGLYEGVKILFK
ncbi:MAG: lysophospholipid acyltransferase family protein [Patescibacteria group bacterium]